MTSDRLINLIRTSWSRLGGVVLVAACTTAPTPGSDSSSDSGGDGPDVECTVNADCIDSEAAELAGKAKCPVPEFFCQKGRCSAKCAEACGEDGSSCEEGVCSASSPSAPTTPMLYCRRRAIACTGPEDCPASPPSGYGGEANYWSCEGHECVYPGVEYPTE